MILISLGFDKTVYISIFYDLKKYIYRHQGVVGRGFHQVISLDVFVAFNVLHRESLEMILRPSDQS
jgi:hypothetical protein